MRMSPAGSPSLFSLFYLSLTLKPTKRSHPTQKDIHSLAKNLPRLLQNSLQLPLKLSLSLSLSLFLFSSVSSFFSLVFLPHITIASNITPATMFQNMRQTPLKEKWTARLRTRALIPTKSPNSHART